jgi:hypothetical protein
MRSRRLRAFATCGVLFAGFVFGTGLLSSASAEEAKKEEKKEPVIGKWCPALEAGMSFTQGTYSDNWNGGDKGSIIWTLIANASLENQFNKKANLRNTLKLAFGQTHQQKANASGSRYWETPQKSTDLIDFESLLRLTLGGFVDPFASLAFQSQFQDASDPFDRKLTLNPMQIKESAGVARQFVNTEDRALLSRVGFTFRQSSRKSFVDMEAPLSGATKTDGTNDGGIEWVTDYKSKILQKRISWSSKLTVYQPVFFSGKAALKDLTRPFIQANRIDPDAAKLSTRISSDWENILSSQITKIVSVSLYTRWIYDAYDNSVKPLPTPEGGISNADAIRGAVRKAGQFKETLSIGITYRFL